MFWESLKVKDSKESSKDSELNIYKRNLIEVIEKLDVLEHGILLELDGLSPEPGNWDITIELNKIKKSIESVKEPEEDVITMPQLMLI